MPFAVSNILLTMRPLQIEGKKNMKVNLQCNIYQHYLQGYEELEQVQRTLSFQALPKVCYEKTNQPINVGSGCAWKVMYDLGMRFLRVCMCI